MTDFFFNSSKNASELSSFVTAKFEDNRDLC